MLPAVKMSHVMNFSLGFRYALLKISGFNVHVCSFNDRNRVKEKLVWKKLLCECLVKKLSSRRNCLQAKKTVCLSRLDFAILVQRFFIAVNE